MEDETIESIMQKYPAIVSAGDPEYLRWVMVTLYREARKHGYDKGYDDALMDARETY